MKAFLIILVALALISCARSESRTHVPEVTGTFCSSLKGSLVLLQLTSDHSFRLTFHAYGNPAPPSSEGKWKIVEGRIELMPVPPSIDGPLKIVGDGVSLVLQAEQVKFTRMPQKTEPDQSPLTTTRSSAPGHL
jgi:hypothetical protein